MLATTISDSNLGAAQAAKKQQPVEISSELLAFWDDAVAAAQQGLGGMRSFICTYPSAY